MIAKVQVDYNLHFFFFSQYAPEFPASKPVSDHIGSNSIRQPEPFLRNIFMKTVAIWCTLAQITDI